MRRKQITANYTQSQITTLASLLEEFCHHKGQIPALLLTFPAIGMDDLLAKASAIAFTKSGITKRVVQTLINDNVYISRENFRGDLESAIENANLSLAQEELAKLLSVDACFNAFFIEVYRVLKQKGLI